MCWTLFAGNPCLKSSTKGCKIWSNKLLQGKSCVDVCVQSCCYPSSVIDLYLFFLQLSKRIIILSFFFNIGCQKFISMLGNFIKELLVTNILFLIYCLYFVSWLYPLLDIISVMFFPCYHVCDSQLPVYYICIIILFFFINTDKLCQN